MGKSDKRERRSGDGIEDAGRGYDARSVLGPSHGGAMVQQLQLASLAGLAMVLAAVGLYEVNNTLDLWTDVFRREENKEVPGWDCGRLAFGRMFLLSTLSPREGCARK